MHNLRGSDLESNSPSFAELFSVGAAKAAGASVREELLPSSFDEPARHSIGLVQAWRTDESCLAVEFKESGSISRADLFALAETIRADRGSWTSLLLNTFGWGWGGTPLGPSRLARILEATEGRTLERNLARSVATLDSSGAVAAYWDLNNRSRNYSKHLGPAFFTKFLYFSAAGGPTTHPRPLILDKIVAVRVNQIIDQGSRLTSGGWSTRDYAFYRALMDRLTERLNERDGDCRSTADAVEFGIFRPRSGAVTSTNTPRHMLPGPTAGKAAGRTRGEMPCSCSPTPAMTLCGVGIFNLFKRSSEGIRSLSDTELGEKRESLRRQFVSSRTISDGTHLEKMLEVFDVEKARRSNEAYERDNPNPPERRHREHGWYLPNDD